MNYPDSGRYLPGYDDWKTTDSDEQADEIERLKERSYRSRCQNYDLHPSEL
jgi:hypothetical protein